MCTLQTRNKPMTCVTQKTFKLSAFLYEKRNSCGARRENHNLFSILITKKLQKKPTTKVFVKVTLNMFQLNAKVMTCVTSDYDVCEFSDCEYTITLVKIRKTHRNIYND